MTDLSVSIDAQNSVLCWLATVDALGRPSVTPKEIFSLFGDDHIVIADIASSNSVHNIRHQPYVCVSFIDVFRQRGFKITGTAALFTPGDAEYHVVGVQVLKMAGVTFPIRHMISVHIEQVSRIWAPSYRFCPEETEADKMRNAYQAYGVVPIKP